MLFILLVAFSALFVAGCAAFFSIKGLIVLFSGSSVAIGIMASSLELGKLVAASFLHNYWKNISLLLKTYLCIAVITLMGITSLGIFGFLTGAHQVHSTAVKTFETKIETLENESKSLHISVDTSSERIKALTEVRAAQELRVKEAGNYKAPREQAYKAISEANEEIAQKEAAIAKDRERLIDIDKEIGELKITMNTNTDIGSFKFVAAAIGTDVDTAIRYFIFALIFVFDPLAVTLVLALNKLIEQRKETRKQEEQSYLENILNRSIESKPVESDGIKQNEEPKRNLMSELKEGVSALAKKRRVEAYQADLVSGAPISDIEKFVLLEEEEYAKIKKSLTEEQIDWLELERSKKGKFMANDKSIVTI